MIAKCANPECDACFDHRIGGKFFRFHLTEAEMSVIPDATQNRHKVIHYWLCPICSKIFRLVHADTGKVALRRIAKEFEVAVYNVSDRRDHRKAS